MNTCLYCGKPTSNPKFCSRSCAASLNGSLYPKRKRKDRPCIECGEQRPRCNKKFCSNKCRSEFQFKECMTGNPAMGTIRRYLLKTREHKCAICEISEWNGDLVHLESDHVSGNSDDNQEENLRLICPNCAAQLPTFKNRNYGQGRHARRQRYAEGKSY